MPSGACSMSSMLSGTSSDRRNAAAKPINSNARSRRPFRLAPVFAAMASNRSAVAGTFLILAVPKVRRMPRTVALTNSSSVGVAKSANLWAYLMAAVRRPASVKGDRRYRRAGRCPRDDKTEWLDDARRAAEPVHLRTTRTDHCRGDEAWTGDEIFFPGRRAGGVI